MKQHLLIAVLVCSWAPFSHAQFQPPGGEIATFPLTRLPISVRCLSIGGACSAVADSVDMLTANPAGAAATDTTAFSVQFRYSDLEAIYLDQDALDSESLGPRPGQLYKPYKDRTSDLAFVGVSKPFGKWTVSAFYQHRLAFDSAEDVEEVFDVPGDQLFTNRNALSASLDGIGLSAAYRFSEHWSAGLSLIRAELGVATVDSWQINSFSGNPVLMSNFDDVFQANRIDDDASDNLVQFGLQYRPRGRFSAGLAYRQGGDFQLASQSIQRLSRNGAAQDLSTAVGTTISLPDTLAVGVAWRPTRSLLFSLDAERFAHSDLPPVRSRTLGLAAPVVGLTEAIDDTTSFRLGFEKRFFVGRESGPGYAVRAGVFTEEDHDGLTILEGFDTHFTVGFGAEFGSRRQVKLDLGIEFGDEEKNYMLAVNYTPRR